MTGAYRENRCRVYREEPVVHLYRETGGPCRRRNPWWSMCRGETVVPDLIRDLHRENRSGTYTGKTDVVRITEEPIGHVEKEEPSMTHVDKEEPMRRVYRRDPTIKQPDANHMLRQPVSRH